MPPEPAFTTESEARVWRQLVSSLGPDDLVLANVRLTDEHKDHELDLVVLLPDVGIVVVEVKGGSVTVDEQGRWWQRSGGREPRRVHPVDQARDGKYALRDYVEQDPRWRDSSRTRVRWGHAVVTPHTTYDEDFATPDCPRWAIHGREDQATLADRLRAGVGRHGSGHHRPPTAEEVDLVCDIVRGRHLPPPDVVAEAEEREATADRLTQEQATLLAVTRLLHRVEVRGGAGSGKTVLALTQAKDLTRGGHGRPTQRVALLCYSIGLAAYLKRQVAALPRKHRPAFVGSFHELGMTWGRRTGTGRTATSGRCPCPGSWATSPRASPTDSVSTPSWWTRTTADDALVAADDEVERLLDEGWHPGHVALLTSGHRHPQQVELQETRGQQGYWDSFWEDDDVFYGHVLGCKELERRAVVLCLNEATARDRAKERLYVGMSRATDRLVVVGDPEIVRAVGGDRVARHLGI